MVPGVHTPSPWRDPVTEHSIPIMFDVEAESREAAALCIVQALVDAGLVQADANDHGDVVSWWTIAAEDKHADHNDLGAAVLRWL